MQTTFIVINTKTSDRFEEYVADKTNRSIFRDADTAGLELKLTKSRAQGSKDSSSYRVELTLSGVGTIIRAEAEAGDRFSAFDIAFGRLLERVRRFYGKRRHNRTVKRKAAEFQKQNGQASHDPESLNQSLMTLIAESVEQDSAGTEVETDEYSPVVIRRKVFNASPMTIDEALYHMELVGHDFYLFVDAETDRPSVVYRRKGWDYGVIGLDTKKA